MDVKEIPTNFSGVRHPWELARMRLIKTLLYPFLDDVSVPRLLDIGCGDGFLISEIVSGLDACEAVAIDTELSEDALSKLSSNDQGIMFRRDTTQCGKQWADALLLLGVLEHQEDDLKFLKHLTEQYIKQSGIVLITVPAYNQLFSRHDEFLGHHRRYDRVELSSLAGASGLVMVRSGYAFSSLLPPGSWPRFLRSCLRKNVDQII